MPTFCFLRNKQKLGEVRGANPSALEDAIKKWIASLETDNNKVSIVQT